MVEYLERRRIGALGTYVFPGQGEDNAFGSFPNHWQKLFKDSPLSDVTPHVLRHSFASIANDLGFTEVTIAALVGHAKGSVTSKYIHTLDTALIMAADTISGYIQGLLDGIEFKQTAYALDRDSRKAVLARFLSKAAAGDDEETSAVWLRRRLRRGCHAIQGQSRSMPFKSVESILQPDPRFADLYVVELGVARLITLADHHAAVASIHLAGAAPADVQAALDRARNTMIYAFFDYDLFVVGEVQAFGAFELALKHRLNGHGGAQRGTLRNLVDRARKAAILPSVVSGSNSPADSIEALISRNKYISPLLFKEHGPSESSQ